MNGSIKIGNKHQGDKGRYIGRGSPLGNPFVIGRDGTRSEVIEKYRAYLKDEIAKPNWKIINELNYIGRLAATEDVTLVCFCKPLPCHGEVIMKIIAEYEPEDMPLVVANEWWRK